MLKRALQLLFFAALVNLVYQEWPFGSVAEDEKLIPVRDAKGKWGFIDGNGRVRIEPTWDDVYPFDELGRACVNVRKKKGGGGNPFTGVVDPFAAGVYGAIDRNGKVRVPLIYEDRIRFTDVDGEPLAWARKDGKIGRINGEGEQLTPFEWDDIHPFCGWDDRHQTMIKGDLQGLVDLHGTVVLQAEWLNLGYLGEGKVAAIKNEEGWWIADAEGNILIDKALDYYSIHPFGEDGLAMVNSKEDSQDETSERVKYGWINARGKVVIPVEWEDGGTFSEGVAPAKRDGKWGYIDERGTEVLPFKWESADSFERGYARVEGPEGWGMIDRQGILVIDPTWDHLYQMNEPGYARCADFDWKGRSPVWARGIVDMSGKIVIEPYWHSIGGFDDKGHVIVQGDGQCGVMDKEGKVVFMREGGIKDGFDANDLAVFTAPLKTDTQKLFSSGRGWIDRTGKLVIGADEKYWSVAGEGRWEGIYVMTGYQELTGMKQRVANVMAWIQGEEPKKSEPACKAYDKHGAIIWDSTWMRPETKAWLFFTAALIPMLVILWRERRGRKKVTDIES